MIRILCIVGEAGVGKDCGLYRYEWHKKEED